MRRMCGAFISLRLDFSMTTPTQTGTVKWFNEAKGFGFIAQDAGGADLFAHFRDISGSGFKTLVENQRVEFEVKQGQKGLQAANIRVLA
jgi:CspA family cold shock protein